MLKKSNIKDIYPLSPMQEGMLFHTLKNESSLAYIEQSILELEGQFDVALFEQSLNRVLERHDVLRTVFSYKKTKRPMQILLKKREMGVQLEDISHMAPEEQKRYIREFALEDRKKRFDLSRDILMRLFVFRTGETRYSLLVHHHHLILDGWCFGIVVRELFGTYHALRKGENLSLPPAVPYKNYIMWLEKYDRQQGLAYWRDYLEGCSHVVLPGPEGAKTGIDGYQQQELFYSFTQELSGALREVAGEYGITVNVLFQAAWGTLLRELNNVDDAVFGIVVSGRPPELEDVESIVGLFVNTVPVRVRTEPGTTFEQLLLRRREEAAESRFYEYLPLAEVQGLTPLKNNLINHLLVFQNQSLQAVSGGQTQTPAADTGFTIQQMEVNEQIPYDFNITVVPGTHFRVKFNYNSRVYSAPYLQRLGRYLEQLLTAVAEDPGIAVEDIDILPPEEKQKLLFQLNDTGAGYPKEKTIHRLFEEQAERAPGSMAVMGPWAAGDHDIQLTYGELNRQADQLAHALAGKGVVPDTPVAMLMERCVEMIIGILGILKAGGAYLPIDPGSPQERTDYILKDSNAALCIDDETYRSCMSYRTDSPAAVSVGAASLAYIIYTSGTTGKPKGVLIQHKNVVRLMINDRNRFDFNDRDVWTMFHSYNFDFSVWEMYGALLYGGKLIVVPRSVAMEPGDFLALLKRLAVTQLNQTPSAFYNLIQQELPAPGNQLAVRTVVFGGEALKPLLLKEWREKYPGTLLVNMYGITETTVHVTYKEIGDTEILTNTGSIGVPIPTLSVYIMDRNLKPAPTGVTGELCVGGDGVARGYLNRPELTAEKFINYKLPVTGDSPCLTLYRSGDLGRYLEDHEMEYLGRADHQVQIRGFRVEPGEIENQLLAHDHIDEAVVVTGDEEAGIYLCGYIVAERDFQVAELREYLACSLPDYMIPAYFVQLEAMPLTPNGKVDRKKLPAPGSQRMDAGGETIAPRNPVEEKLAQIWRQQLAVETIGVTDSFFHHGGDSIKSIRVVSAVNAAFNADFKIVDLYTYDTVEKLAGQIGAGSGKDGDTAAGKVTDDWKSLQEQIPGDMEPLIKDIYPMSDIQAGMVFHSLMDTTGRTYHDQFVYQMMFPGFHGETFKNALQAMVEKHSMLRTAFDTENYDRPVQLVYKSIPLKLTIHDISSLDTGQQEAHIKDAMARDLQDPFELACAPLWRMQAFLVGKNRVCFLWCFHHAILDGWSNASLMTELNNTYLAMKNDARYKPEPLQNSYKDFVIEQAVEKGKPQNENFWKKELEDYKRVDISDPLAGDGSGQRQHLYISRGPEYLEQLRSAAARHQSQVRHLCFAAYLYMLYMTSYENDLLVGMVTNNRPLCPDGDKIVGCFLNTIPVRMTIPQNVRWKDYLRGVEEKLMEIKRYERSPLAWIADITGERARAAEGNAFFDTAFDFTDFYIYDSAEADTANTPDPEDTETLDVKGGEATNTLLDMDVSIRGGFSAAISYYSAHTGPQLAQRMGEWFMTVLDKIIGAPEEMTGKSRVMDAGEKEQLLLRFNDTQTQLPDQQTFHRLFEACAASWPQRLAASHRGRSINYRDLDREANRVAHFIMGKGVAPGSLMGLYMKPGIPIMAAIIGAFKAGCGYLPVEADYPSARVNDILADSEAALLISEPVLEPIVEEIRGQLPHLKDVLYLSPDETVGEEPGSPLHNFPDQNIDDPGDPHQLAYVIYTSGTTGKPKGVMIHQRGMINHLYAKINHLGMGPEDILAQTASICFDISVWQFLASLLTGGRTHIVDKDVVLDPQAFLKELQQEKITILESVPSLMSAFLEMVEQEKDNQLSDLRWMIPTGEALTAPLARKWYAHYPQIKLVNAYGPTEASDDVTHYVVEEMPDADQTGISIGKPLQNLHIYILDKNRSLCPIGVKGEICVAGIGVGKGYLKDPEKTRGAFIPNPYLTGIDDEDYAVVYKTGDIGYYRPDGNLECLGRIDHQVKLRGFRIELGEIESRLQEHPGIGEAVVMLSENRLSAYITGDSPPDAAQLKEFLAKYVPDYMIPTYVIPVERMPLSNSGKIDRSALSALGAGMTAGDRTAPRSEKEERMTEVWAAVLNISAASLGIDDNFFEVGGHSLNAVFLVSQIHKVFQVKIPVPEIFNRPTIRLLTEYVEQTGGGGYRAIEPAEEREYYPFTSSQRRMYFVEMVRRDTSYNMPRVLLAQGPLDPRRLETACRLFIQRHESARTSFQVVDGIPMQRVHKDFPFAMEYHEAADETEADAIITDFIRPFDFTVPPLIRLGIIRLTPGKHVIMTDMHHIINDLVTDRIFDRELLALYDGNELPPLPIQYKDYAVWQNSREQIEVVGQQKAFWLEQLGGRIPILNLPLDFPRPEVQNYDAHALPLEIDKKRTARLRELMVREKATMFMGLLTIYTVMLAKVSGQEDVVVGTGIAGRRHADLENIVGYFLNTIILRNYPTGHKSFIDYLRDVKERTAEAFENQEYEFDDLLHELRVEQNVSRNPLLDVLFTLETRQVSEEPEQQQGTRQEPEITLRPYKKATILAKFDLGLFGSDNRDTIKLEFRYCTALFKEETVRKFVRYFDRIIDSVLEDPTTKLADIGVFSEDEKKKILQQVEQSKSMIHTEFDLD